MDLIQLSIKGISYSQTQAGAYALILEEVETEKKLPIIIGNFEAQSIALILEKDIHSPRPITHDLIASIAKAYDITVNSVVIHKLEDGIFYSNIECVDKDGKRVNIDSRTSDAIAVALRFDAPIFTTKDVMEKAGVFLDVESINETAEIESDVEEFIESDEGKIESQIINELLKDYSNYSTEELKEQLAEAVNNEDYEKAAQIRDELSKR